MTIEIVDCEQGTPEWLKARSGVVSASCFSDVLAQGKGLTRAKYMRRLAGEIITGEPEETFKNPHMERGNVMEAEAREWYSITRDVEPVQVGFIRNGRMGYSPDSLIGSNGLLEIKTAIPSVLIEIIQRDTFPPEHKPQCQGGLMVSEREWIDIECYWPGMPKFVCRAYRDEIYIANLRKELSRFTDELDALVEKIRAYQPVAA